MSSRLDVFVDHAFSIERMIDHKVTAADTDPDMSSVTSSAGVRIAMLTPLR